MSLTRREAARAMLEKLKAVFSRDFYLRDLLSWVV
jgi:hypothetical protein